jgi:hypothetical protein
MKPFCSLLVILIALAFPVSASTPFATLSGRGLTAHKKVHLLDYFTPTEEIFMKGPAMDQGAAIRDQRDSVRRRKVSYVATLLKKFYAPSQPWQNYTEEGAWSCPQLTKKKAAPPVGNGYQSVGGVRISNWSSWWFVSELW